MKDVGNENIMASEDHQGRPPVNRLGFHEIIPGLGSEHAAGEQSPPIDIPEFNLDHQMMAGHRKATAQRRVGSGQKTADTGELNTPLGDSVPVVHPESPVVVLATFMSHDVNAVVADMVRRDIDRLCQAWAGIGVQD